MEIDTETELEIYNEIEREILTGCKLAKKPVSIYRGAELGIAASLKNHPEFTAARQAFYEQEQNRIRRELGILAVILTLTISSIGYSKDNASTVNIERLAQAIYKAEGGAKTKHPYGILQHYKKATPRQACINTIKNHLKRHAGHKCGKDFISCLGSRYCPTKGKNLRPAEKKLNPNWVKNVKKFYFRLDKTSSK